MLSYGTICYSYHDQGICLKAALVSFSLTVKIAMASLYYYKVTKNIELRFVLLTQM